MKKETKPDTIVNNISLTKTWLEENPAVKTMMVDALFMIKIITTFERIGMEIEEITIK